MEWTILLIVLAIFIVIVVTSICTYFEGRAFRESHPPITDEEFVKRCGPGTDPEVALKVRRIFSEIYGLDYERIYPEDRLLEDLKLG